MSFLTEFINTSETMTTANTHILEQVLPALESAGGNVLFVGGCVRDQLIGAVSKDIDIEVYDLPCDQLIEVLSQFGKVAKVGVSFSVVKMWAENQEFDFSFPRRDSKAAPGHAESIVQANTLTPREAAFRRDFTINSMARTQKGELLDPFNGEQDLNDRLLRATSQHFSDDADRVLRGMQFAARFEMTVEAETAEICRDLKAGFGALARERVWAEFKKLCEKGVKPSMGIQFLIDTGWLELFPELHAMLDSPQDPEYHPEGCVLTHTMHCMDAAADIASRENVTGEDRLVLVLSMLCHDIGKPATASLNAEGRYTHLAHAEKGVAIAQSFMQSIGANARIIERVKPLVKYHMVHLSLQGNPVTERFVRRLAVSLGSATINELNMVVEADMSGRPPIAKGVHPTSIAIVEMAKKLELDLEAPVPLVQGRHLIEHFNVCGGPAFKPVLDAAFEAQLNGSFDTVDGGLAYIIEQRLEVDLLSSQSA